MKLIESVFNKETGESYVTLQDRKKLYKGKAKLHPNDNDIVSRFFGCHIAEARAWIEYYKHRIYENKIRLAELNSLKKDFIYCFNKEEMQPFLKRIEIKEKYYIKLNKELREDIKDIKTMIKDGIEAADKLKNKKRPV